MNLYGANATLETVILNRRQDVQDVQQLYDQKLPGRYRTDRAAPTTPTDVIAGDALGDVVVDATYIYTLINVGGVLKWHRVSTSVGW